MIDNSLLFTQAPGPADTLAAANNEPDGLMLYTIVENLLVRWSKNEVDLTWIMTFIEKSAEIKATTASLRSLSQLLATS